MKINVVKDKSGKTIATFEAAEGGPQVAPVLAEGRKVEQVEVAENYKTSLGSIYS